MKNSKIIFTSILAFLAAYAAFAFTLYYFVVLRLQERLLTEKKQEIMEVLDKSTAGVTDSSFLFPDSLKAFFSASLEGRFKIKWISVLDEKGRSLTTSQDNLSTGVMQSPDAAQLLKSGQSGFYFAEGEKPLYLHLLRSFSFKDRITGGVETAFDISDVRALVRSVAWPLFLGLLTIFLMACALFIYRMLRVNAAHNEIKRALLLIESGHFGFEMRGEWSRGFEDLFHMLNRAMGSLKERDEKREALFERAKHIAASQRLNDMFDQLTESLKTEAGAEQIIIMLIKDDALVVNHTAGYDENLVLKNEIYKTQEDVFTEMMDYGKPLVLEDALEIRQNVRYRAVLKASGLTALFPITLGNEIFGLVHVSRPREKGPYKAAEMDAGAVMAGGAAIGLMRLTEGAEIRPAAREITKPELREFSGPGHLNVMAVSLTGAGWVECFELTGEKKEDMQILCVHGVNPELRAQMRDRVTGMLDIIRKFRTTLGNLSYFALSMLLKMPVSGERELFVKQFMENPFTPEGLYALFSGVLSSKDLHVGIEIIKIDVKKKSYLAKCHALKLFLIPEGIQASVAENKGPFKAGDCLIAAPENLLSVQEFEMVKTEKVQDKLTALLQTKFDALKARAEEGKKPCPAVIIIRQ